MASRVKHDRLQSNTRLDIVQIMLRGATSTAPKMAESAVAIEQRDSLIMPLNDLYGHRLQAWANQAEDTVPIQYPKSECPHRSASKIDFD